MANNREINWEEVEIKVSVICNKFKNIRQDYIEDLAQELRIHAFHKSDDYYDLYRRAIDFWRSMKCKVSPEMPYFDMEIFSEETEDQSDLPAYEILAKINAELDNDGYLPKEQELIRIIRKILDLLEEEVLKGRPKGYKETKASAYFGGKLSITWICERTGEPYKKVQNSMDMLQNIVRGLAALGRIEIDDIYL